MPDAFSHDRTIGRQRAADEAFFEDWSEWTNLDDLPERPTWIRGERIAWHRLPPGKAYHRYYCRLSRGSAQHFLGGPYFELALPPNHPILLMVEAIPGCRNHPLAGDEARHAAYGGLRNTRYIPAEHWRALRSALPAIKAAVSTWARKSSNG